MVIFLEGLRLDRDSLVTFAFGVLLKLGLWARVVGVSVFEAFGVEKCVEKSGRFQMKGFRVDV